MNLGQLKLLRAAVDGAIAYTEAKLPLKDMTIGEEAALKAIAGDCDFIIGDFAITDLSMKRAVIGLKIYG